MLKKIILILLVWGLHSAVGILPSYGQSLDSIEYFYDADPGAGNGNVYSIALSDSITDSISFNFPGLTPGFHTLNFRVQDTNGTWSLYESRTFFLNDTIFETQASFDSSSAEYFFDTDPGVGNGTAVKFSPGDSIQDTTMAIAAGLLPGFHNLYVRVKDSNNLWSLYEGGKIHLYDSATVSALPVTHPLKAAEYFFDTDPGPGNGTALNAFAVNDSIQFSDTLPTAPLTAGTHWLYVRVLDTMNVWSLYDGRSFVICSLIPAPDFSADTVCLGKLTTFTDLSTKQDTASNYTYAWDFDNNGFIDDTTRGNTSHVYFTSGTHTVSLAINNTNGCVDTVWKTIYIDSLPTATLTLPIDTLCKDDTLLLSGGNPAGGTYSGNGVYSGALFCDSIGVGIHTISYTYFNSDSCSVIATDVIYISACTGIHEYAHTGYSVKVSPNPFRNSAVLSIQNAGNEFRGLKFVLYDIFGKEVRNITFNSQSLKLERENLPSGVYLYKLIGEDGNYVSGKLAVTD